MFWATRASVACSVRLVKRSEKYSSVDASKLVEAGSCLSSTTSARAIPYADRMEEYLCTITLEMPRE